MDEFEKILNEIDLILDKFNNEQLTLKQSVEMFEDGYCKIKKAKDILNSAQLKITQIIQEDLAQEEN